MLLKIIGTLFLLSTLLSFSLFSIPPKLLQVHFLNVGQGDSILIQTPSFQNILIDGGPESRVLEELGAVLPFFHHKIDLLILTHPHADHLDGLVEVLKRYQVSQILLTGVVYNSTTYQQFLNIVQQSKTPIIIANSKQDFKINQNTYLDILYPLKSIAGQTIKNINNSSIILKLIHGKNTLLLGGDAEREVEELLLNLNINLKAETLKAGHHGSKTANSLPFLKRVNPTNFIIQVGSQNKFNHPHSETLKNAYSLNLKTFRTDIHGRVSLIFSPQKVLSIKPQISE